MPLAGIIVYSIVLSTTMPRLNASALTLISGILLLSACASGPPTGEVMELPVFPPAPEEARFYYERSLISTADVEIESGEARLERMLTGVTRTGIGMSKPFAVSVHQGRVSAFTRAASLSATRCSAWSGHSMFVQASFSKLALTVGVCWPSQWGWMSI
jgi:hypothetical protein